MTCKLKILDLKARRCYLITMTKKEKFIQKIINNPENVSFGDLCHAIEMFGFKRKGGVACIIR